MAHTIDNDENDEVHIRHIPSGRPGGPPMPICLCCPCGERWLHHGRVTVYSRPQEDGPIQITNVAHDGCINQGSFKAYNPSGRRSGIAIYFWCEQCGESHELTIAQHKGETQLEWRRVLAPEMTAEGLPPTAIGDDTDDIA